jgi:hypothetical protein
MIMPCYRLVGKRHAIIPGELVLLISKNAVAEAIQLPAIL